jgi:mono/diheme cytochrome c family protein
MMLSKPTTSKRALLLLSFVVFSSLYVLAQDGKTLYISKCASCHNPFKEGTGPALGGLEDRHKWADHKELLAWVNNPGGYMAKDPYTQGLKAKYGSMMTGFPDLKLADVTAIVNYINSEVANKKPAAIKTLSYSALYLLSSPSSL